MALVESSLQGPSKGLAFQVPGHWLVAIGVTLWTTETAFRIPLGAIYAQSNIIVFLEHLFAMLMLSPFLILHRAELFRLSYKSLAYIAFSGAMGSAVGAVCFTEALRVGNPTTVNLVLNLQPVLTIPIAHLVLGERLSRRCLPWVAIACLAGMVLAIDPGTRNVFSVSSVQLGAGIGLALTCAVIWATSTVAGRAATTSMSLPVAAALRVTIGFITMSIIVLSRGLVTMETFFPPAVRSAPGHTLLLLFLLASVAGGIPLLIFFAGLRRTPAAIAAFFEMLQTPVSLAITWGIFGHRLLSYQITAGIILFVSVVMVQRADIAPSARPTA